MLVFFTFCGRFQWTNEDEYIYKQYANDCEYLKCPPPAFTHALNLSACI